MAEDSTVVARLANGAVAVEQGRLAVTAYLQPFDISPRTLNRVEVVLEELVGNVVRHGRGVSAITVAIGNSSGAIDLAVEDDGEEFDPLAAPDPAPFTTLTEAPLGGLGIPLIRKLTSAATYERIGNGSEARNRMTVRITNN